MNDGDRDPVFYYKRASRLRQSNSEEQAKRKGLFKRSPAARANIMVFVSIIIICVMFGISTRMAAKQDVKFGGNTLNLKIVQEEGILILNITKKAPKSGEFYTGVVDISVSRSDTAIDTADTPEVFFHRVTFNLATTETFRVTLPFEGNDFFVGLKNTGEQKSVRVRI